MDTQSTKTCLYCGENPIPHFPFWFYESLDICLMPIRHKIFGRIKFLDPDVLISDKLIHKFYKLLKGLGVVNYNFDIAQVQNSRARVLWKEASARQIPFHEVRLFGRAIDCYIAQIKDQEILFFGLPRPQTSKVDIALKWLDDKALLKQVLKKQNLPVAEGSSFANYLSALKCFHKLTKPVVVKPRRGSRGRHTTTYIYTEEQFKHAFNVAKQLCFWVVVEEQLYGDVFRGTTVNGRLVGVLGGSYPYVAGDGTHTIAELIEIKNQNKLSGVKDMKVNEKMVYYLARNGKTLNTTPILGEIINLSEKIGVNYGGTSYEVTDQTHPDIKEVLEQAAKAVASPILGFDFIIPDITKSPKVQKMGIIECNGNPFINLHHEPLIGKPRNVAAHVWDLMT